MDSEITTGYAEGLLKIADAEGEADTISAELFTVAQAVDGNDDLRVAIADAGIPAAKRQQIVEDLVGPKASPTTTSLVSMIVGAGRGRQLSEIARAVGELVAGEQNKRLAEVRSAVPLTEDQRQRLAEALRRSTGSEVEIRVVVDPNVVGGLVTQIGDTVIDGSIRHRLTKMRESFA